MAIFWGGAFWGPLGSFWGPLGSFGGLWGHLGGIWGHFRGLRRPFFGGVILGVILGVFGVILGGPNGVIFGVSVLQSNGWDPAEMFRFNEENYGVKTTYDSSLAAYT